jgi:hypothetical protein
MAFWSSQTLEERIADLVDPPDPTLVDCDAVPIK